jgi:uncharacterized 2Fe-2S/4Fe-4S cluster protein (DUF4445 family)
MARVVFTPSGHDSTVAPGTTVLDAARQLGVDLDSVCGGRGICGRCAVVPSYGSFPKWAITSADDAFGPFTSLEAAYAERKGLPGGLRLGCQLHVTDDAVIDVPPSSQVHRPVVRKTVDVGDLVVDPIIQLYYVEVEPAHLGDDRSAAERLIEAVARDHSVNAVTIPVRLLPALHKGVNDEGGTTVAVARGREIVAIWPGYVGEAFGVAIDIGSTTVAGHLCDLHTGEVLASSGLMNPQIRFGEDLMSRVSYVMMNPGGDVALTAAIREALDDLIGTLVAQADITRDRVLDLVLVGNPIMHHIVLGIDPTPLGGAPFELAVNTAVNGRAADVGCALPNANLYIAPCIAGHVGADTAAAILSEGPHRSDRVQLLVDVGTNAEIVLGNSDRLYAASSPTGPAFEGAQISCGQRATVGAIERVRIDRTTLEPSFKLIGHDVWDEGEPTGVCGSGIIEVIGELFLSGILRTDGTFNTDAPTPRLVADGRTYAYVVHGDVVEGHSDGVLRITQNDIRAIQLAKSALRAGIELLRDHSGFTQIDDVRLAGAFGSHIDPLYALVLGLVPDCPVDAVRSAGNAAGSGAVRSLLSAAARVEMETVVAKVTKIETALEPAFQQHFVDAMGFPHTVTPTPHLALAVALPEPSNAGDDSTRRRSRRSSAVTQLTVPTNDSPSMENP